MISDLLFGFFVYSVVPPLEAGSLNLVFVPLWFVLWSAILVAFYEPYPDKILTNGDGVLINIVLTFFPVAIAALFIGGYREIFYPVTEGATYSSLIFNLVVNLSYFDLCYYWYHRMLHYFESESHHKLHSKAPTPLNFFVENSWLEHGWFLSTYFLFVSLTKPSYEAVYMTPVIALNWYLRTMPFSRHYRRPSYDFSCWADRIFGTEFDSIILEP